MLLLRISTHTNRHYVTSVTVPYSIWCGCNDRRSVEPTVPRQTPPEIASFRLYYHHWPDAQANDRTGLCSPITNCVVQSQVNVFFIGFSHLDFGLSAKSVNLNTNFQWSSLHYYQYTKMSYKIKHFKYQKIICINCTLILTSTWMKNYNFLNTFPTSSNWYDLK